LFSNCNTVVSLLAATHHQPANGGTGQWCKRIL